MTEQVQNGQQQTQEDRYLQEALSFYGQAMGRVKSQVQNYREQLEQYSQQLPDGDAQAQIQEMIDSYSEIEGSMDQATQDAGVEDVMSQAVEQTQQQMQEVAQGATQQVQDTVGGLTGGDSRPPAGRTSSSRPRSRKPRMRPCRRPRNSVSISPRCRVPEQGAA
jgi:hypothetical protein